MKIRSGFVSNSSSSSFVIMNAISADKHLTLLDLSYESETFETNSKVISIKEMIKMLEDAQKQGCEKLCISYGGGYDG